MTVVMPETTPWKRPGRGSSDGASDNAKNSAATNAPGAEKRNEKTFGTSASPSAGDGSTSSIESAGSGSVRASWSFTGAKLATSRARDGDAPTVNVAGERADGLLVAHDDPLIDALERAVALEPADADLRAQLIRHLIERHLHDAARHHCMAGLWIAPDHLGLLAMARVVAEALEAPGVAAAFGRVADALGERAGEPLGGAHRHPKIESGPDEQHPADGEIDAALARILDEDERSRVRLADVAGLEHVKGRIRQSFLSPLHDPDVGRSYGVTARGGLLLYGPPGCGKTHLARALAGELGLRFIAVGLHDVLDMWFGASERNLHQLFESARERAPALVFFDEVDAVGHRRSRLQGSAGRNVVAQLLEELDPVDNRNDGLFVLGASNAPWDVDPALRRPGRFDRTLFVAPPDAAARSHLFEVFLRDRPVAEGVDVEVLAAATAGFSGADVRLVCDAAAQEAMSAAIRDGREVPVSQQHLVAAARTTSASTSAWFQGARNVVTFADRSGEYAELADHMRSEGLL